MGDAAWAALISGAFAILALLVAAVLNRRNGSRVDDLTGVVDEWRAIAQEAKRDAAACHSRLTKVERELERCEARSMQLESEVAGLAQTLQTVIERLS